MDRPLRLAMLRAALLARDGNTCWCCGLPFSETRPSSFEHLIPESMGGRMTLDNLVLAHETCNALLGAGRLHEKFAVRERTRAACAALLEPPPRPVSRRERLRLKREKKRQRRAVARQALAKLPAPPRTTHFTSNLLTASLERILRQRGH